MESSSNGFTANLVTAIPESSAKLMMDLNEALLLEALLLETF